MPENLVTDAGTHPLPRQIDIAIDTEFRHIDTLLVQTACRLDDDTVCVQLYYSPLIPGPPVDLDIAQSLRALSSRYEQHFSQLVARPAKPITSQLSPAKMVVDLLDLANMQTCSRRIGKQEISMFDCVNPRPPNVSWNSRCRRFDIPSIDVRLIAHFLTADFFRVFGVEFLWELLGRHWSDLGEVVVRDRKLLSLVERRCYSMARRPTVEYMRDDVGNLFALRLDTFDTILPFVHKSLDALSGLFLGIPKIDDISIDEKRDMVATFHSRPNDAYLYSAADVIIELLLYEQMQKQDKDLYRELGFSSCQAPPLRRTVGSRVAESTIRVMQGQADGSDRLKTKQGFKVLLRRGGLALFEDDPRASRYGSQTGRPHGGLLFSRSPTKLFHNAPGMLRDVDLSGCYNQISTGINVYIGRPLIVESGNRQLSVREAVTWAREHADDDAWFIRATGAISSIPNALIPSTLDAVTSANYNRTRDRAERRRTHRGFLIDSFRDIGDVIGTSGTKLFSRRVESGVVTAATYEAVQVMPSEVRADYEHLTTDSIVLYPRRLVAEDGGEYDRLYGELETSDLPWETEFDLERLEIVHRERVGVDYISLRFPLGEYAAQIRDFRSEAQRTEGAGSAADQVWKIHANSIYGVLASPHLDANNFMAANQITATARAAAFVMVQALNGVQVITDGCTYRRDQIPACNFSECLARCPDYTLRRAEEDAGIPYLSPDTIPADNDTSFTQWYQDHATRFFNTES